MSSSDWERARERARAKLELDLDRGDVEDARNDLEALEDLYQELADPRLEAWGEPDPEPRPRPLTAAELREVRARIEREKAEERASEQARKQARRRARPLFGRGSRGPRRPRP